MSFGVGKLQARLLLWFLGAIVLAVAVSLGVSAFTSPETSSEMQTRVFSRHVQRRLAKIWDDRAATDAYVRELRDTTGLDLQVRRDATVLGDRVPRGANNMVFEDGVAYFPVVKDGATVGALELRTETPRPRALRLVLGLGLVILALGIAARRVSVELARPLEDVARAATRFGGGDLRARTEVEKQRHRWVAEEVRDVGRAFDGMADRIERIVNDQRELLAAISHELRSPLGRARVALEIAREKTDPVGASASTNLDDVDRQLVEMDAILGDLLASARAGLADLRRKNERLAAWLRSRVAAEKSQIIELEVDEDAEPLRADVDGPLLGRALHNLFVNAWAHGHPKDEPLVVGLSRVDDRARIVVRDRGPGFSESILPRAFEPFVMTNNASRTRSSLPSSSSFSVDASSKPQVHGIGLGLTLVRRIVEAHGGTVSARNVVEDDRVVGAEVAIELETQRPRPDGDA